MWKPQFSWSDGNDSYIVTPSERFFGQFTLSKYTNGFRQWTSRASSAQHGHPAHIWRHVPKEQREGFRSFVASYGAGWWQPKEEAQTEAHR